MNSVIVRGVIVFFAAFSNFFRHSITAEFFVRLGVYIKKGADNSLIVNWFRNPSRADSFYDNSLTANITSLGTQLLGLFSFLNKGVKRSFFVCRAKVFAANMAFYSIRLYGVGMITFSSLYLTYRVILGRENSMLLLALTLLSVCGGLFVLINKSIANLWNGSKAAKLIGTLIIGKSELQNHKNLENEPYLGAVVSGILCFVSAVLFGTVPTLAVVGLLFLFVFVLHAPAWGCIAVIGILPFVPTMGMVMLVLAMGIVAVIRSVFSVGENKPRRILHLLVFLMGAMVVYGAVSSFAVLGSARIAMVYLAFLSFYFTINKLIDSKTMLFNTLSVLVITSFPVAFYGIYQKFYGADLGVWVDQDMFSGITSRVVSFFENPNVFGEYLIILILLAIARLALSKTLKEKFVFVTILALLSVCMIFTFSRGCWVGIIIAVALFFIMHSRKTFAFLAVAGVCSIFFLPATIITRISSIGNVADSSTSYRVSIWEGTIKMLQDFWATGIGLGTDAFNMVYPLYAHSAITAPHPHNLYLQILTELGVVGLIVFVFIILVFFKTLLEVFYKTDDKLLKVLSTALVSAMTGFLVQGMFDNVWYNYRIYLLFWIFVALGSVIFHLHRKEVGN